ncbi:MAG: protein kinase [Polyangiales bacterium]
MSAPLPERNDRFVFEARLGVGASGSVYRAFDRERNATVAVKVLSDLDAASIYRFKSEFRALTGIAHRNLVQLYDLISREEQWLLTMELVEGGDFLRWIRPPIVLSVVPANDAYDTQDTDDFTDGAVRSQQPTVSQPSTTGNSSGGEQLARQVSSTLGPINEARLRSALRQLAEGLGALHAENRLHRDLKPANVLVFASDGRLVICDFGLVTELRNQNMGVKRSVAGTLAYMSPEQASGQALGPAADWYAVGVMLYQTLTGVLPVSPRLAFEKALQAKQQGVAIHPCSLNADAPQDLADLAVALLDPEPSRRPRYAEVLARIDGTRRAVSIAPTGPTMLVGRSTQRAALQGAFTRAWSGRATVAMVCGRSGMGKSTLVQQFLDELRAQHDAVVLTGRCYEREELPYKAFDPVIDALGGYLLQLGDADVRALLPDHIASLARLFPSLRRVPMVSALAGRGEVIDPIELKRNAFSAFRQLCSSIAELRPLVLYIDDLQWGDLESLPLFEELLRAPLAPSLLLVGSFRSEDAEQSPLLKALRNSLPALGLATVDVVVDALSEHDARELARSLLRDVADREAAAERVVKQAAGSPFFVRELALYVRAHGASELRLEDVIAQRLDDLPPDSRRLFELVAVAGRPERSSLLAAAAKLGEQAFGALRVLEASNLVHGSDGRVEASHDRLREMAYRSLDDDTRRSLHEALAEAIEQRERDPDALLEHYRRSGKLARAGQCALEAAHHAEAQLAHARAAKLYREALDLAELSAEQKRDTEERLGICLALSGRGIEAAAAFSRATVGAAAGKVMVLRSLATTELLRAGSIGAAYDELRNMRSLTGVAFPTSAFEALASLLWRRVKIWFAMRWHRQRDGQQVDQTLLQRADMLWGIGATLVSMDTLRGAVYQAEHLLVALRAGEPYRLARAMAVEGTLSSTLNTDPGRTQSYFDRGLELGGLSNEPHALTVVKGTAGAARLLEGRWHETVRLCREAAQVLRERINATLGWELTTLIFFDLQATAWLGRVDEIIRRVPEAMRDAEARGDLYAATSCRSYRAIWAWLGADQLDEARRQVAVAEGAWQVPGYNLQHWYTTFAVAEVDLYAGEPARALERLTREYPKLLFLRVGIQYTRIEVWYTRGRLQLAQARKTGERELVEAARKDARAMMKTALWGRALGRLLLACATSFDAPAQAASLLQHVEGLFDALDMPLMRDVARCRRAQLREDSALVAAAEQSIRERGVVRPDLFVAMLAPGFPTVRSPHDSV